MTKYFRYHTIYYRQEDDMTLKLDMSYLSISKVKPILESDINRTINFIEITQEEFNTKLEEIKRHLNINRKERLVDNRISQVIG